LGFVIIIGIFVFHNIRLKTENKGQIGAHVSHFEIKVFTVQILNKITVVKYFHLLKT
jgi:hypothetical protein